MGKFENLGKEIGSLVDEKNAAYGNSFGKVADFLKILWPNGIPPEAYTDALCVVRMFDKLMRIANKKDAFGESPYRDIGGYALLGAAKDEDSIPLNDIKKPDLVELELNFLVKSESDSMNDLRKDCKKDLVISKVNHFENKVVTVNHKQKCGLGNEHMMITSRGILKLDKDLCFNPAVNLLNFENEIHETILISNILDIREGL